jgi:hypothetical protein
MEVVVKITKVLEKITGQKKMVLANGLNSLLLEKQANSTTTYIALNCLEMKK